MKRINTEISRIGKSLSYPEETELIRQKIDKIWKLLPNIFPFSVMLSAPFYVWTLLILLNYAIFYRKPVMISLLAMPTGIFLVCLTGPCNGYYARYLFPVIAGFPLILAMILTCEKRENGIE